MLPTDSQCFRCRHFDSTANTLVCDAYPRGIPPEMFARDIDDPRGPVDHRFPYAGDNGIQFEATPGRRHPLDVLLEDKDVRSAGQSAGADGD